MLSSEINLCLAAGINVRNMQPFDVFLTAGNIINDHSLTMRMIAEKTSRQALLEAMDPVERKHFAERVRRVSK